MLRGVQQEGHRGVCRGAIALLQEVCGSALGKKNLDPILGGRTCLWFFAWISHMVLGVMVFGPW